VISGIQSGSIYYTSESGIFSKAGGGRVQYSDYNFRERTVQNKRKWNSERNSLTPAVLLYRYYDSDINVSFSSAEKLLQVLYDPVLNSLHITSIPHANNLQITLYM
jgi:hypothetical protein